MAKRARIRCINKTDRQSPHKRIRNGGVKRGELQFFVSEDRHTVDVIVATHNGITTSRQWRIGFIWTFARRSQSVHNSLSKTSYGTCISPKYASVAGCKKATSIRYGTEEHLLLKARLSKRR
jgi:hypothetical protein